MIQQEATEQNEGKTKSNWFTFERNEILLLLSYFLFGVAFANYEPYAPLWLNQIFSEESFLIIGFVVAILFYFFVLRKDKTIESNQDKSKAIGTESE